MTHRGQISIGNVSQHSGSGLELQRFATLDRWGQVWIRNGLSPFQT